MHPRLSGLWQNDDFLKLWAGQSISMLGTQVSLLALPLAAVLTLHATPAQMGLLTAAGTLPGLLVGLFAGVWVDRHGRRPLLIGTNLGRGLVLLLVPAAAMMGLLRIELLYAVALASGLLGVFFSIAYQSYLPAIIPRAELIDGNSKLMFSQSAAQVAGPGLAGALVALITAPIAIVVDALSFVVAGFSVLAIRSPEAIPSAGVRRSIWLEAGEGLRIVWRNPLLRPIGAWAGTFNFFGNAMTTMYLLFLVRDLHIGASLLGLIFGAASIGGVLMSLVSSKLTRRFGLGRSMTGAAVLLGLCNLPMPFLSGSAMVVVPIIFATRLLFGAAVPAFSINASSLQQAITPDALRGRMNATMQFLVMGTLPLGSLFGGLLGTVLGVRGALGVAVAGLALSSVIIVCSPLRVLREQPSLIDPEITHVMALEPV